MEVKNKMTKILFKVLAWIFVICGILAYFMGWVALLTGKVYWNIPTEFWFYDAISTGIIGLFFLIYFVHSKK